MLRDDSRPQLETSLAKFGIDGGVGPDCAKRQVKSEDRGIHCALRRAGARKFKSSPRPRCKVRPETAPEKMMH